MNQQLKQIKATLRSFMRSAYSDEKLCQLLAHAQSGKLCYQSCCCFIGMLNANHALAGYMAPIPMTSHYVLARAKLGASDAESAFRDLATLASRDGDALRRLLIIPMIRAELKRRERRLAQFTCTANRRSAGGGGMNAFLRNNKIVLRQFMRQHYSTERLCALLAHAQSGKLAFYSCCCFIGAATADHALKERSSVRDFRHYAKAKELKGAGEAERAFILLAFNHTNTLPLTLTLPTTEDRVRRTRIIPIIKAELKRRAAVRKEEHHDEPSIPTLEELDSTIHAHKLQRRAASDALGARAEWAAVL